MLNAECGWTMDEAEFTLIGKRLVTLQRAFSRRENGLERKDDVLAPRMKDAMPEGPGAGKKWNDDEIKKMQDDYYAYFGWDSSGIPTEACLKEYGLDFCSDCIKA